MINKMSMQKAAWIFAIIFLIVFVLTNIPAFNDADGKNFGLFKIDPIDNLVHLLTAILGFLSAINSPKWSKWFLLFFGYAYMADAGVGLLTQRGLLDFSLFQLGALSPDFKIINIALNLPHIGIAALMIASGHFLRANIKNNPGGDNKV